MYPPPQPMQAPYPPCLHNPYLPCMCHPQCFTQAPTQHMNNYPPQNMYPNPQSLIGNYLPPHLQPGRYLGDKGLGNYKENGKGKAGSTHRPPSVIHYNNAPTQHHQQSHPHAQPRAHIQPDGPTRRVRSPAQIAALPTTKVPTTVATAIMNSSSSKPMALQGLHNNKNRRTTGNGRAMAIHHNNRLAINATTIQVHNHHSTP